MTHGADRASGDYLYVRVNESAGELLQVVQVVDARGRPIDKDDPRAVGLGFAPQADGWTRIGPFAPWRALHNPVPYRTDPVEPHVRIEAEPADGDRVLDLLGAGYEVQVVRVGVDGSRLSSGWARLADPELMRRQVPTGLQLQDLARRVVHQVLEAERRG